MKHYQLIFLSILLSIALSYNLNGQEIAGPQTEEQMAEQAHQEIDSLSSNLLPHYSEVTFFNYGSTDRDSVTQHLGFDVAFTKKLDEAAVSDFHQIFSTPSTYDTSEIAKKCFFRPEICFEMKNDSSTNYILLSPSCNVMHLRDEEGKILIIEDIDPGSEAIFTFTNSLTQ